VNSLPATILAMNMERVFTQIDTNERNVFHDSCHFQKTTAPIDGA
ncbi:hypothetical protein DFQ50_1394, partial [Pseudocitrobacter faecalis]